MTDEQLKSMPVLGNLQVWSDTAQESEPVSSTQVMDETSDLPF